MHGGVGPSTGGHDQVGAWLVGRSVCVDMQAGMHVAANPAKLHTCTQIDDKQNPKLYAVAGANQAY